MKHPANHCASASMPPPGREVIEKAAEWHATLSSGEATEDERDECLRWRNAHPGNEEAYQKLQALSNRFDKLPPRLRRPAGSVLNDIFNEGTTSKRNPIQSAMLGISLLAVSFLGIQTFIPPQLMADYQTGVGERQSIALSDGSRLVLNTDSAVKLEFDEDERRLVLHHGELMVEVAQDPARPFVVETSLGTARALGTRYSVRNLDDIMDVVVTESKVEVCRHDKPALDFTSPSCVTTHQGQMTRVRQDSLEWSQDVEALGLTAWTQGRLVVNEWPLPKVLEELERYRPGLMHFDSEDLSDLKISGVFPLDDTEQALGMLSQNLPIHVSSFTRFVTLIRKN